MKLSKLNEWLSLLANLGVLAGIIAVIVEINQNTAGQKVTAAQQVLGVSAAITGNVFSALAEVGDKPLIRSGTDFSELTPIEESRFRLLAQSVFANHWQVYYQHRSGFLDQEIFDAYERRTKDLMANALYRAWWREGKFRYSESFQLYVDELIASLNSN